MKKYLLIITVFILFIFFGTVHAEDMCTEDVWSCGDWSTCTTEGQQTRSCSISTDCPSVETPSPTISQSCNYTPPACTLWAYSDWGACATNGQQSRTILSAEPGGCVGGNPLLTQECVPLCGQNTWECGEWNECIIRIFNPTLDTRSQKDGAQTRACTVKSGCSPLGVTPAEEQSCTPKPVISSISPNIIYPNTKVTISGHNFGPSFFGFCTNCKIKVNGSSIGYSANFDWSNTSINFDMPENVTSGYLTIIDGNGTESNQFNFNIVTCKESDAWNCSEWSNCINSWNGQTRTCVKTYNTACQKIYYSSPKTWQTCTPPCSSDTWSCGNWTTCSSNGSQTRDCNKTNDCATADTPSPTTAQNCTPPQPTCFEDTWSCGDWGSCSPQGIQTRSCNTTFDCSGVETASPATSQYCTINGSNNGQQPIQTTSQNTSSQDQILKSTVRLICLNRDGKTGKAGSGTIIDSHGTILTNYHVVEGTSGLCRVGFINNKKDNPNFTEISDVKSVSASMVDAALLKIRGGDNKQFSFIDISKGNSDALDFGSRITTYGYPKPESYGPKITYTSGDFSGFGGPVIIDEYSYDLSDYFKTTAPIDHGNSGGGAYSDSGTFAGMPTLGPLGNVYYILSINSIKNWINSFTKNYDYRDVISNSLSGYFSSANVNLEDVDVRNVKLISPPPPATIIIQKSRTTEEETSNIIRPNQTTKKPITIESNDSNKDTTSSVQNASSTPEQQPQKISLIQRFFLWLSNLFSKLATR